jgi:outer membrane protein assembly factor BamB
LDENGLPLGWSLYGGKGTNQHIKLIELDENARKVILIDDGDANSEIGLMQTRPVKPGLTYEASVETRAFETASAHGAYLQLRFLPSQKYVQTSLAGDSTKTFEKVSVKATAPPDTKSARIYLYTHRSPTPKVLLRNVVLISGVDPPPPPPPAPVPPVYSRLKDLHLTTELVSHGKPNITIIEPASGIYGKQAKAIQEHIAKITGIRVPITTDDSSITTVPFNGHVIVLGNRSTNKTIGKLYNRYYSLLDLRYPGQGGYVVRTLHNPFGNGKNVIFVGGSDFEGVSAAAGKLIAQLGKINVSSENTLSIGWLAEIKLGKGIGIPRDLREFETWEASEGYGSTGYFGWNSISKRMAMYYMTGDPFHAREFIRLAFPDEKARREIAKIDGERIENKNAPLSGPYHYNAHMMILFWDLIEESPVFSDAGRLRVTNAFSRQLNHRKGEGIYGRTKPPSGVGSRHGQWSAISLFCLGRYFQKDYPNPIWQHCVESAKLHFKPLHKHAWVSGESDNLFWYNTGIAPVLTYLLLTGDRKPVESGVLETLLRGQEMLISGRRPDWALRSASVGYLHKAAYLMQDGRYVYYRRRTGVDVNAFRLGQSFWPEKHLEPQPPEYLVGKWSINCLPEPMWRAQNSGLELGESFLFGSFRTAPDASGDFILIDGFNGASRNPYHTFAILELRLDGRTLLKGYRNQLITRADGLVETHIPMDAALKYHKVLGKTATVAAEVAKASYCNWRRTLAQREQRYALVVDDLTFRTDSDNLEIQIQWETERTPKTFGDGHVEFDTHTEVQGQRAKVSGQIWPADLMETTRRGRVATMRRFERAGEGQRRVFFSLVGNQPHDQKAAMSCARLAVNAAALALPSPALAVVGEFQGVKADLAVVAKDHLYAKGLVKLALELQDKLAGTDGKSILISVDNPIDIDWDFTSGKLHIVAVRETRGTVALAGDVTNRGRNTYFIESRGGADAIRLAAGEHVFDGAKPPEKHLKVLATYLDALLAEGNEERSREIADASLAAQSKAPQLRTLMSANVGGKVVDLISVPSETGDVVCAAEGKSIHLLSPGGKVLRVLDADGAVRMLHWWHEHRLLLAGCADEQVIAFDETGKRKWVFTSEMDPAVYRAAKTYWFKTAPGHEGIHGLSSGVFLDGESQAFVGSACTLEILDENGKLVRRMPQFWGKVSHFAIIDGPDKTLNLLASRKYNGTNRVGIINNKTLDPTPRGFHTVPPGATYVPGWSSMNRHHLFYEDLNGDGEKEVISEINGTWNRVTVWRADGKALYDASFGPGERIPAKNMRDVEVADLDGNGQKEILVATSSGLIVTLDRQCRKLWAQRLASPPVVMKCVAAKHSREPWIYIGCEDGAVIVLDGKGELVRSGKVTGRPACVDTLDVPSDYRSVLFGTDRGEVKAFELLE